MAKPPRRRLLPTARRELSVYSGIEADFEQEFGTDVGLTFTYPVCPPIEPTPKSPEVQVPETPQNPPDSPRVNPFDWPESDRFDESRPPPAPTRAVRPTHQDLAGYSSMLEVMAQMGPKGF